MHISEGVLSAPVLISGGILSAAGVYLGLKKLDNEKIPLVALISAAFFVASLIHVPLGPTSVHLILNGLAGILLGWAAFPAILIGLFLQAILFQFGGLTTLGVNTFNMAFPSIIVFYMFMLFQKSNNRKIILIGEFLSGFLSVFFAAILVGLSLFFTGKSFFKVAELTVVAHVPVMIIEGFITLIVVEFLKKVKPEIMDIKKR
jgi:cobalt/nickel transport system permease protein